MTKKRFKLSMAALGLLAAFFMVLIAVLLAPTLASANKDGGKHHGGMPGGAGYPIGRPGGAGQGSPGGEDWNAFGHEHGNAYDAPFCVESGDYPCAILGDPGDGFDGGNSDSFESGYPGGDPQYGQGSPNDNGRYTTNFWTGGPGGGNGGAPGGGNGGIPGGGNGFGPNTGNGPADEKCGKADEDQSDAQDDDETKSCDTDPASTVPTSGNSNNLSSDLVDPDFGDDDKPKTEDGPKDENTPPGLAVTEVPEPLTLSLFAVGLAGAAGLRRRSRKV